MDPSKRLIFICILFLSGCETGLDLSSKDEVERLYSQARPALENEEYAKAFPIYRQMISLSTGEIRWKIYLEYCHGLLRAERFETAINCSNTVIKSNDRELTRAALEIKLTAEHERYLVLASSDPEETLLNELRASLLGTLDEILSKYQISELDTEVQIRISRIENIR